MRTKVALLAAATVLAWGAGSASAAPPLKLGMVFKSMSSIRLDAGLTAASPSLDQAVALFSWDVAQPTCRDIRRGRYDWAGFDSQMAPMDALGVPVIATFAGAPRCASYSRTTQPRRAWLDEWVEFARRAVLRYPAIREVEVWSEPNLKDWQGGPRSYRPYFLRMEKAIGRVKPSVKVLVGGVGFCCDPEVWLRRLYRGSPSMRRHARHVGAHAYSKTPSRAVRRLLRVRRVIPRGGTLAITEHAWSTCPRPSNDYQSKCVSRRRQAQYMGRLVRSLRSARARLDLRSYNWFQAQDFSTPQAVRGCGRVPKAFYGIWTWSGEAKPSQGVWENLTNSDLPEAIAPNPVLRRCAAGRLLSVRAP